MGQWRPSHTRAPKRELGPDWRDALRESVRRLAVRTLGRAADRRSPGRRVALASHSPTDPSLSTAAGGPPTNWLGSFGAYASDVAAAPVRPGAVAVPAADRAGRAADGAARAAGHGSGAGCWLAAIGVGPDRASRSA